MELSKNFLHTEAENKWYQHWMEQGYFYSTPDERPAYTIVMPPPNVTGILHMGHALNNTVQDILIRHAKMNGFNTCWVPGTDHASIATEAKVVAMLRERGINKNDLSREEFLKYAWEWKEKYGGIILEQLKKLGCSLDWKRTHFTMDPAYYNAVLDVFIDLHEKGKIYRDVKMINWDPQALTSLSDEEVLHKPAHSKLYYVNYKIDQEEEAYITIATVRPETILGDTAVCVHPEDPRYSHLKGKHCIIPIVNRKAPIIFDEYIDISFGTGALKVTPAHDVNDHNLGKKHGLEVVDTLNANGTMSAAAAHFEGMDRFVARKKIVEELQQLGLVEKIEDYENQVGYSERTNAVVEPRLSMQWWCDMKSMATPALEAVMNDVIKFIPPKYKNVYRHWMENIKDWNISRQLSWGQRIPVWYDDKGNYVVAKTLDAAIEKYQEKFAIAVTNLQQDEDCLDTWFSSWLWPMQVFGWNEDKANETLRYYYPTNTLITAPEIIFFWVARMIMAGYEYLGEKPFQQVYFTGIVRDKQGRKMSKQLGNSPDLLKLIEDFGADAVRFSVLISSPAGNDLLYDEHSLEQGKNFMNKMWNALKLIRIWQTSDGDIEEAVPEFAVQWMEQKIEKGANEINALIKDFRLSEALKTAYSLIWDDFCSWYLEWIKPSVGKKLPSEVLAKTVQFYDKLLQLLHPFLPFITEEIFHQLADRKEGDDLMVMQLQSGLALNEEVLLAGDRLKQTITLLRDTRNKNNLKPKDVVSLHINTSNPHFYQQVTEILMKQLNADTISFVDAAIPETISAVNGTDKIYLQAHIEINKETQKLQLQKEQDYLKGFLKSVQAKLQNEKFVQNAKPEVVANEQKKQQDALDKLKTIEESLAFL